ncbi:MAG: hypothetical protein KC910_14735 [Candidatus Eremiobacteraeota bacterium]|nr:hypothetical protein [Candidatus Eremiobacteraeota bacterium]
MRIAGSPRVYPIRAKSQPTARDVLLPPCPEKPADLPWVTRHGVGLTIGGTMATSIGTAIGASFADGGLAGRAMGLTFGAIAGMSAGFFVADLVMAGLSKVSGHQFSPTTIKVARGVGMAGCLATGWALGGHRLPDEFVLGPMVPGVFLGMFSGIGLAFRYVDPVIEGHREAVAQYEKDLERYHRAVEELESSVLLKETDDYVEVGDITLDKA